MTMIIQNAKGTVRDWNDKPANPQSTIIGWAEQKESPKELFSKMTKSDEDLHDITCEICDTEFKIYPYSEGKCPKCGTWHEWAEYYAVVLSDPQKKFLREAMEYGQTMAELGLNIEENIDLDKNTLEEIIERITKIYEHHHRNK